MEKALCIMCRKPKGNYICGVCTGAVCKACVQFVDDDHFSFLDIIPAHLAHGTYCGSCYDVKVAPEDEAYQQLMNKAKRVAVFFKDQGKETRAFKRIEKPFEVKACRDRSETLLRLAFFAAKSDFNTLVDTVITSKQIRQEAYQTSEWSGRAVPVTTNISRHE